ncbi:MAG: alanine--tRNA ligase [Candidatus Omnitrophica bacterium]|nr:alanine--tRNA ligase [Candidatus Omnitrophota bacterium]
MNKMTHNEIRKKFLGFFKDKNHTIVSSDVLVPAGDPTVLFTSAGMNQFKEQFLGRTKGFTKAASCQKCLRTDDLKNVGVTSFHHTFFEMLGNFSFGDYFKQEAISWAWEFMTKVLKIPEEKLSVSVYKDDDEAYCIWKDKIKIPETRIRKLGDKDNFWPAEAKQKGPNGPCGPCSEIFYENEVEVWNLVFTQFNRKEGGVLEPLPSKNIDTGMGLERLCAVMQRVKNNFETDLFAPIINSIKHETSVENKKSTYAIADHIRAISFAISDGITPSNEERGYVIRNLIRLSAMHGRTLGIKKPFLYKIVSSISNVMEEAYPELKKRRESISAVVLAEEEKFISTLEEGMNILEAEYKNLEGKSIKKISGEFAFRLFDTHGFPFELTQAACLERGFRIDEKKFQELMQKQREQSRSKSTMQDSIFKAPLVKEKTEFTGYDTLIIKAKVVKILKGARETDSVNESQEASVVLDKSPFYAEKGGQVSDAGVLSAKNLKAKVLSARPEADAIILNILVEKGILKNNDEVTAEVDKDRRLSIARNHTATHLLQSALKKVLGEHVKQQGSLVEPERLRFDFAHFKDLSEAELDRVEQLVNEKIQSKDVVSCKVMDMDEAKKQGALAFFGDKYESKVRVISSGDYSSELCGGTHVNNTGDIGLFKIISESAVASGIRRIEAVTGTKAQEIVKSRKEVFKDICNVLKCNTADAQEKAGSLILAFDKLGKRAKQAALDKAKASLDALIANSKKINDIVFVASKLEGADAGFLRNLVDMIKDKLKNENWVVLLSSLCDNQAGIILAASGSVVKGGFNSGKIVSKIASSSGGSGGGRPDMAQGGVKNITDIDKLQSLGEEIILEEIKK